MNQLAPRLARLTARTPGARLFAIIDAARAPAPVCAPGACLYDAPPAELAAVAPYLLELDAAAVTALAAGFGQAWCVFLDASLDRAALRIHLRTLLRVRDPVGKPMLFRFYDPRVLRVFLPTCTVAELRTVFGPIHHFYVEDDAPETLLELAASDAGLMHSALTWSAEC